MNEDLSQLDLIELLQRLEPIAEPAPVSLWPQTAAWVWAGLVLLLILAWGLRRWLLTRRANAYRRAALAEIAASDRDPVKLAAILRRTALAAFPRTRVAGLHGEDWLEFLDRSYGGQGFCNGPGRALASIPYSETEIPPDLEPLVVEWIKQHRADGETQS
ncbi:MAG: DUF4381 domain-containing protein [Gammaproteobacteria bacterium]|nr:MAG: DUF4381 domain-containing protein [Gammaproteobacteria bacterium]UCH40796.1 MAG: DUF4381 domain-containing protein [Gammaproteobacteria bacterium]